MVKGFDPEKEEKYLVYLDANNLYGYILLKQISIRSSF